MNFLKIILIKLNNKKYSIFISKIYNSLHYPIEISLFYVNYTLIIQKLYYISYCNSFIPKISDLEFSNEIFKFTYISHLRIFISIKRNIPLTECKTITKSRI